jgi:hypothetical protein
MKKIVTAILLLLFMVSTVESATKTLFPSGWRPAGKTDYLTEDLNFVENIVPNHITADFNGDGIKDEAWLLKSQKKNKYGLFIFMGRKGGGSKMFKLAEYPIRVKTIPMGIVQLEPGSYKTACGKGYWDCAPDEPETLVLKNPGVDLFQFESADSVFYWNAKKGNFKRVWLSD